MTEAEYRAHPGVNKSTLWALRQSPAHYRHILAHPRADTPAMKLGRAVHAAVLQPRAYRREYAVLPEGIDRRTKAGKELLAQFEAENAGKEQLSASDAEIVRGIRAAVLHDPAASALLKGTRREKPYFWNDSDTGILCKCRVDAVKPGVVIDLKTTLDASTDAFTRDALRHGYDVQAAHYIRGVQSRNGSKAVDWFFIAVEKEPPYAVNVLHADQGFIDRGTWRRMALLDRLKDCQERDEWPSYGTNELILPSWAELED